MQFRQTLSGTAAAIAAVLAASAARAQEAALPIIGAPVDGAMALQPAASPVAQDVHFLDNLLLVIITVIVVFVMLLLAAVILRYNSRANPKPATFTHNSPLEVTWTIVPIVILVFIGAFSLPVLFNQQEIPEGDINIKVTGYQWYWGYEYTDEAVAFESFMVGQGANTVTPEISAELAELGYTDAEFRLATDTAVVVPVGATVVLTITAADVIHSWALPAFGVKQDGVPGRLAQAWFRADQEGVFFGQCSELCGKDHSYMPITVHVVSQEAYDAWLATAKVENPA